ncbi:MULTISPECIES: cupin domain-containing protein [unclassified Achromobacter]|uniref:cupin domain-containing protein n=1 Tax=unclassified Achromobacter TaxID=2626865 RepID=UPI0008C0448E|nr:MULTISPECIES: cupin domain-containing protein [unclassified Achromobacter]SEJ74304.1 Mannose-6-phosphate isomerase, cupin superfamily [Achromobacter sp. NFACC18-2]SIT09094.1 Mannose-6-phosphate isomerase, cupin superfamily [Achromobacter sp. MFA1 R4]
MPSPHPINLAAKLALIQEHWMPKVIAEMNDYQFKLVKLQGEFVWHAHADTDETFIVIQGRLRIALRDGEIDLGPGEMTVIPKGVEHKPCAPEEVQVMLIEPRGVVNTGDQGGPRSAPNDVWI